MSEEWNGPQNLWQCFWGKGLGFYKYYERNEYLESYVSDTYGCYGTAWKLLNLYWSVSDFFVQVQDIRKGDVLYWSDDEKRVTLRSFLFVRLIRYPITSLYRYIKYDVLKRPYDDLHIGCYSYPNCDIDPNGCSHVRGIDVETYGHRD